MYFFSTIYSFDPFIICYFAKTFALTVLTLKKNFIIIISIPNNYVKSRYYIKVHLQLLALVLSASVLNGSMRTSCVTQINHKRQNVFCEYLV